MRRALIAAAALLAATFAGLAHADQIVLPPMLTRGAPAKILYRLDKPATGRGTLAIEWTDADHRLVERRRFPFHLHGQAQVTFPLDLGRATVTGNHLRTHLEFVTRSGSAVSRRQDEEDISFSVPPADYDWNDYQIILWQPHDALVDKALRRLGVTASTVHGYHDIEPPDFFAPQVAPLLESDLGWYVENIATDFYSAYHRWFPNRPVNWRFAAVKQLYQQDPTNPAAYRREPGLSDPAWLQKIRKRLIDTVQEQRRYRPLFYNLADEPGIAELSVAWDFDFSQTSLVAMRRWLKRRYGTLAALDRQWGTRFTAWRQVTPLTTRAAMRRADGNYSAWADFKAWMDVAFARAVRSGTAAVHAADPEAKAAIEGTQVSGWGGYDYARLARAVDVMEIYDDGENLEAARSFNPNLVLLTTAAGGQQETHEIWQELFRGTRGVILWDPKAEIVGPDGTAGVRGRAAAATFRELRNGLGALLIGSRRHLDPIAILYSPASLRTQWLLDWQPKGDAWSERDANSDYEDPNEVRSSMNGFLRALEHAGLQPRFVSDTGVAQGALRRGGERVLILPRTIALSLAAAGEIRRFTADGEVVIADGEPGAFDQHSRKLPQPSLATIFRGPAAQAGTILSFGKGKAINLSPEQDDAGLRRVIAAAGVSPAFPVTRADGAAAVDVESYVWRNGGVTILALQRDFSTAGAGATAARDEALSLALPKPSYVYDLRRQTALGRVARLSLSLAAAEPMILAVSDRPLPPVAIAAPKTLRLGQTGVLRLFHAGASAAARDIFHVEAIDPLGKPVTGYSGNVTARRGVALWRLPLALNDPVGRWRIEVTDLLNGDRAAAAIPVADH